MSADTQQLIQQSLQGDQRAFGQIVERYQGAVSAMAYSVTGNLAQSEDLAQEAFIIAWKKLGALQKHESLSAWLCGIARNLARDWMRTQAARPTISMEHLDEAAQALGESPEVTQHQRERADLVWTALAEIPESYREPLILFYRQGESIRDIAEALGLSEDNVKQRLSRGRKLLRAEVARTVQDTLADTRPGKAFTAGVIAALPALYGAKAGAAELGKLGSSGSAAWAKSISAVALKSAPTIGGMIAVKKIAVAAAVIVIACLVFVQQQHFSAEPVISPPPPESVGTPIAEPEPIQEAVVDAPPTATMAADTGPSITGVVLDHEDNPVEGATANLWRLGDENPDPFVNTQTGADGSFTFRNVAPSKQVAVMAKKDGMVYLSTQEANHVLTESGLSGVVVRLYPESTVEGRVVDLSGRPVADKEVTARYHNPENYLEQQSATTDSAGRFQISKLLPGTHGISVIPENQFSDATADAEVTVKPGERRTGVEIVYAGDDFIVAGKVVDEAGMPLKGVFVQLIGVDGPKPRDDYTDEEGRFRLLRIPEGSYLTYIQRSGYDTKPVQATAGDENMEIVMTTVEQSGLIGRVVAAETGEPITRFDVQVTESRVTELHESGFGFFKAVENENGEFSKEKVRRGHITVIVRAPGREMKYEQVDLTQGPPGELVVRLERSAIVNGIVVSSAGAPVPDAYMLLSGFPHSLAARLPEGDAMWTDWLERNKVARSKEDGTFEIDSLIPELNVITAYHPDYGFGSVGTSKATVASASLRIVLTEGGTIEGKVAIGGVPLEGAGVSLARSGAFGENPMGGASTDENGNYQIKGVPAGTWMVALTVPTGQAPTPMGFMYGRRIERAGIVVTDGHATPVDFHLPADGASLEGVVLLEGQPATNGYVTVFFDGSEPDSDQIVLDGEGRYRFDNLPEGRVRVVAFGRVGDLNQRSKTQEAILATGETSEIDFELTGGVTLQGTVGGLRPEEGHVMIRAVEGVVKRGEIHALQEMRLVRAYTQAEADGAYRIEGLEPGTYTLFIDTAFLEENDAFIRGRDAQVVIEVDGADGNVMQLDPVME